MELDIDVILADLKEGKVPRTQQNLDKLNDTLKAYAESGQRDFSITQIGRVSAENGGLAYEALRATRNKHYRTLIEAWAAKYNTNTKKTLSNTSRSKSIPADNKLLERIPDPAVRALFGQIIAERNRYRKEVNLLKQHANITIDKRPVRQFDTTAEPSVEVLPSLSGVLTESEKKALAYAISDECMEKNDWQTTQAGQVKEMEYNSEVFPRGFVTGLRKLLGEVDD
ncbi:gamma-mobile-trio protein GmtX [Vibrio parahaemolyticus]|uniref:gamma-mobile-trio protein GmtX n=1 Tax=Vibrio parahaemolyticus TaxID=670 RepID=UPI0015F4DCEF|nr:gamma-mobile-trio protein GmtX [Vibrio parahaemolyticus]